MAFHLPPLEFRTLFPGKCNESVLCTPDAFHIAIQKDSSEQACVCTVITNGSVLYTRMYNSYEAGGPSMCCVRWSNEAATVHADITVDHRDVPAFD